MVGGHAKNHLKGSRFHPSQKGRSRQQNWNRKRFLRFFGCHYEKKELIFHLFNDGSSTKKTPPTTWTLPNLIHFSKSNPWPGTKGNLRRVHPPWNEKFQTPLKMECLEYCFSYWVLAYFPVQTASFREGNNKKHTALRFKVLQQQKHPNAIQSPFTNSLDLSGSKICRFEVHIFSSKRCLFFFPGQITIGIPSDPTKKR